MKKLPIETVFFKTNTSKSHIAKEMFGKVLCGYNNPFGEYGQQNKISFEYCPVTEDDVCQKCLKIYKSQ